MVLVTTTPVKAVVAGVDASKVKKTFQVKEDLVGRMVECTNERVIIDFRVRQPEITEPNKRLSMEWRSEQRRVERGHREFRPRTTNGNRRRMPVNSDARKRVWPLRQPAS